MELLQLVLKALGETLYMVLISTAMAYLLGLPLGIVLVVTDRDGLRPNPALYRVLGTIVNILRSAPFIILMLALIPITRFIVGTSVGSSAAIVPLVIAAAPFVARLVESSLREVDHGVIEASLSMGASVLQTVGVMLREALSSLITGAAIAITTILGYSTMAGFVGGGGLGAVAINYGYYRNNTLLMLIMVAVLVVIVEGFQAVGNLAADRLDKRKNR